MPRLNKTIAVFIKVIVSSGLIYLVLSKAGIEKIIGTIAGINILYFIFAALVYIFSIYLSSVRWQLLLPKGFKIGRVFSLYLIGAFFNNILPGIIGGDAIKAYYLYKDNMNNSSAVASVFMDRYIGFAALMFIGLAAFPFGLGYFKGSYIGWLLPVIVFLFIIVSLLIFGLRLGRRFSFMTGFYDYFIGFRSNKKVILKTFLLSIFVQTTGIFSIYALSLGLKIEVPLLPLLIFVPIISTISTIPISISGIGVREASFVMLLGFLGITPAQATAISFSWFLSIVTGSLPGFIEYLRHTKSQKSAKTHNQNSGR